MDDQQLKLACLKLARPDGVMNPDPKHIIERAQAFYDFVTADKATAPAPKLVAKPPRP